MKKRDNAIDFFRGIAAIWIVFIHTCFWSGTSYVPAWIQSLSLIIDVPLFVFISGMTFNFHNDFFKSLKGIIKIWYKWLLFLILYFLILFLFSRDSVTIQNIIAAVFFKLNSSQLPVISGSLWFIYMFFVVVIFGNLIICLYNKKFNDLHYFLYVLALVFLLYGMNLYYKFLPLSTSVLFHTFFYLLGYYLYNYKWKSFRSFVTIFITLIVVLYICVNFNGYTFIRMQEAKGICHLNYFLYSMISIVIVTYLKDKLCIKRNAFCFVGTHALMFYFCQGIGSSLLYKLLPHIQNLRSLFKLPIMFLVNLGITTLLAIILIYLEKWISKFSYRFNMFEKI